MKKVFVFGLFILLLASFVSAADVQDIIYDCTDSDGGLDASVKGTTSGQKWGTGQMVGDPGNQVYSDPEFVELSDYCGEKGLYEYFCSGGSVGSQTFSEEDGCLECIDGTCVFEDVDCGESQCEQNGKCYDSTDKIGIWEYCSPERVVLQNKLQGESCDFDYECPFSYICYKGICIDNKPHVISRMWSWFKGLFS